MASLDSSDRSTQRLGYSTNPSGQSRRSLDREAEPVIDAEDDTAARSRTTDSRSDARSHRPRSQPPKGG